jgi:hypothetical protein
MPQPIIRFPFERLLPATRHPGLPPATRIVSLPSANRQPLTATTYLLNSGNNSGVAPAFVQTKAATSTAR